ncbi:MAG: NAD(P)H-quinone oxidoreductase [Pseudolabrys sp.]|nr:NAD(P)H-quinone oxidoreductase [Pseudolabrys sp.]
MTPVASPPVMSQVQQAIVISAPGGPEVLVKKDDWPLPVLDDNDVLIEVIAAGVNRHDCNQRKAGPAHEPNPVPGLEAAGRIVACGRNVSGTRIGEMVMALTDGGSYAQYVATRSELALPIPENLDWISAATLPEALFTTWFNFFGLMQLKPGECALIHGATSGVGSIATQLLTALGYKVYGTAGTAEKRNAALGFGCVAAFDYNDPDLPSRVRRAAGGRGIDAILDMSAGAHIDSDLAMIAQDGRIAHLSAGGGKTLQVPLRQLMAQRVRITGGFLRATPVAMKIDVARQLEKSVWPLLGTSIKPHVEATYPLDNAAAAHRHIETNSHIGKIALTVSK